MIKLNPINTTLIIIILAVASSLGAVYAQLQVIDYKDTLSGNDTRKSFGYCPPYGDMEILSSRYNITYTIESCPTSRTYIDNWDRVDDITKLAIVQELESKGYRMESN